jgi:hypothetical protein
MMVMNDSDTELAVETMARLFVASQRNYAGCVICGKQTRSHSDTSGDGILRASVLLSRARFDSNRSPLCADHWYSYILFRLKYSDEEDYKIAIWLLTLKAEREGEGTNHYFGFDVTFGKGKYKNTASVEFTIKHYLELLTRNDVNYTDNHGKENWRGDLAFNSASDVLNYTEDEELRTAIFRFFRYPEDTKTIPAGIEEKYLEATRFRTTLRFKNRLSPDDKFFDEEEHRNFYAAMRYGVKKRQETYAENLKRDPNRYLTGSRRRKPVKLKIIQKDAAISLGLKRYFTGEPCLYGHISERFVTGGCVECSREASRQFGREHRDQRNARKRRWYRLR